MSGSFEQEKRMSRSEKIHIGDSLYLVQGEIESTLDQIEVNSENMEKLEIIVCEDGTFCDHLWINCNNKSHMVEPRQLFLLYLVIGFFTIKKS